MSEKTKKVLRIISGVLFLLLGLWKLLGGISFIVTGSFAANALYVLGLFLAAAAYLLLAPGLLCDRDRLCRCAAFALIFAFAYSGVSTMLNGSSANFLMILTTVIMAAFAAIPALLFFLGVRNRRSALGLCIAAAISNQVVLLAPLLALRGEFNALVMLEDLLWPAAVILAGLALAPSVRRSAAPPAPTRPEVLFVQDPDMLTDEAIRERTDNLEKLLQAEIISYQEYEDKLGEMTGVRQTQDEEP